MTKKLRLIILDLNGDKKVDFIKVEIKKDYSDGLILKEKGFFDFFV